MPFLETAKKIDRTIVIKLDNFFIKQFHLNISKLSSSKIEYQRRMVIFM